MSKLQGAFETAIGKLESGVENQRSSERVCMSVWRKSENSEEITEANLTTIARQEDRYAKPARSVVRMTCHSVSVATDIRTAHFRSENFGGFIVHCRSLMTYRICPSCHFAWLFRRIDTVTLDNSKSDYRKL